MILRNICQKHVEIVLSKKIIAIFFFLESSETYADPSLSVIGSNLYFSKIKIRILINEKKKIGEYFDIHFRTL